jgi:hypothetical protein
VAQVRGNSLVEQLRPDRLEEPGLLRAPQAPGVDRHQDIGGAARALLLHSLDQRILARLDAVDLDAGGLGEVGVERLVGLVVARGVEVEDLLLGMQRSEGEGREKRDKGSKKGFHTANGNKNDSHLSMGL